jgi:hypothetical protein
VSLGWKQIKEVVCGDFCEVLQAYNLSNQPEIVLYDAHFLVVPFFYVKNQQPARFDQKGI